MEGMTIRLAGEALEARPSGALYWPAERMLVVGDLHLGRAERLARRGATLLPPYETDATMARLADEVRATDPRTVVCLGDSFDDDAAADGLADALGPMIVRLAAGRGWVWVAGNHDPRPAALPGEHAAALAVGPVRLRHIAGDLAADEVEVSAHYHPKAHFCRKGVRIQRRCFLADRRRVILPAFGTYTGGLDIADPAFRGLIGPEGRALVLGRRVTALTLVQAASAPS